MSIEFGGFNQLQGGFNRQMNLVTFPFSEKRKLDPHSPVLGTMGSLETRLARSPTEIRAAQRVRYEVFFNQGTAVPGRTTKLLRRDRDSFDRHCDHLLVIDISGQKQEIVGTYRMLPQQHARMAGGFYTQSEFNIEPLLAANSQSRFLELGRSCILPAYRSKRTMELMWHGLWTYVLQNQIDIMFGCASIEGTEPSQFETALCWLNENAVLSARENCPALGEDIIDMSKTTLSGVRHREALSNMPPLLKGYLRLGAKVSSEAMIDRQFGTTDVLVVVKVSEINPKYLAHYGSDASRFVA